MVNGFPLLKLQLRRPYIFVGDINLFEKWFGRMGNCITSKGEHSEKELSYLFF